MCEAISSNAPTGNLLKLSGRVRLDGLWLGPATAALAGLLATDTLRWNGDVFLLVLLADLGWGNIWWAVAGTDWASMRERWSTSSVLKDPPAVSPLPFAQTRSPAGQLARWWADWRAWIRLELWPERGAQLGAILIGLPLALVLSAVLDPSILLLTVGGLAVSQMALFLGPADGYASPLAQAVVEIGVPWLAAGVMFDRMAGGYLGVAAGLVLAYAGLVLVGRGQRGGVWLALGQGVIALVLLVLHRPLAAAAVGALIFPQLALFPWSSAGLGGQTTIRLAQWPFLAAILVAAVAL